MPQVKLIPKHQTTSQPLVVSQDNTRVENSYIESIPITETAIYKQYLADPYRNTDFNTWKKRQELIQSNKKDEKVKADKRSSKVKEQETKQGEAIHNQQQRKELEAKVNRGIWTGIGLGGLALAQATPAAPYIDAAFTTHGALGLAKQADEGTLGLNLETGLHALEMLPFGIRGVGKAVKYVDDVAREAYAPYDFYRTIQETTPNIKGIPYNVGWGPKQTIKVVHATDSQDPLRLFFDKRWDVTTEGANPFGVWYQGKWGQPRTAATNSLPGKAEKAAKARKLFENRKYKHQGEVTLEKPLTTVGDVPDRSTLSYDAEKMGADGLIYNNVYDNGFDNNQVILSFKTHTPSKTTPKTVTFEPKPIIKNNLTSHVQGEEAVKMFKEYGGVKIPEGSINGKELSTYVQEARIRYGLVGNTNISDQEIAEALYKHVNELGKNTKALNAQGEPQLLFRGDTKAYTELKNRLTPDELLAGTGTMDNSLGTLFLGDITTPDPSGVGRYLVGYKTTPYGTVVSPSATGATSVGLYDEVVFAPQNWVKIGQGTTRRGPIGFTKAPAVNSSTGVNDLNAFVVKTGNVRNATDEIAVGNEILLINGNAGKYRGAQKLTGRQAMADHYNHVLSESKASKQGLLKSDVNAPLRDEHSSHEYFALPNWNKHNAKHILPYDLRIPRNWSDPNIYKTIIPVGIGIGAATNK